MTTPNDIGWGKYSQYEGPYFKGTRKFQLPDNPSEEYKVLAVITKTEGGAYNAINAYDRCIISVGLLQWCEAKYYLSSRLLGSIANRDPSLLKPLQPALDASGAEFKEKSPGKWRFFWKGSVVCCWPHKICYGQWISPGRVGGMEATRPQASPGTRDRP